MPNPHKLIRRDENVIEVAVKVCVLCNHPVIAVPDEDTDIYCMYCELINGAARLQKIYITKDTEKAA
jgi:hypothetical protein